MDSKQYYASISINKTTQYEIRKLIEALFTSDIDISNVNINISEAFDDEEEESIHDIIDELVDNSPTPVRTIVNSEYPDKDSKQAYADYIEGVL